MARDIDQAGFVHALPNEVPLFPLPDHVFLPSVQSPYRVFEPRYRKLVEQLLDQSEDERWLAIPRLGPEWRSDYHGAPSFNSVATVGRMVACDALRGGHFYIVAEGVVRCRLTERLSSDPFRVANIEPLPDLTLVGEQLATLKLRMRDIVQTVYTLVQVLGPAASDLSAAAQDLSDPSEVLYRLAAGAVDDPDTRQVILEERLLHRRAAHVQEALTSLLALAGLHTGSASSA
ncbi:MAG: LON peptidase substrate-binding domain-containing protein [Myxococcota bacterium]|jgi:Lon protease-like protein|nr:LON peptidase substrate-binding domain-containing protein [Myxococcota bacterium]